VIDEFCAHRGVSLWFGRVEECGIRCAYHGWKYDVNGQCLEVPSELEHNRRQQLLARLDDAGVGGDEPLLGTVDDRPHALLKRGIESSRDAVAVRPGQAHVSV
jgi:Rieske [2Fe-2S] domain